jgi:U32 family peptidase
MPKPSFDGSTPRRRAPEILAPAGDEASLSAALRSGADAVYFGLSGGFNARARAANFSLQNLPATVARIHRARVRAYLTLNTLVFEPELEAVEHIVREAASAGVDALIVQDPAVALIAHRVAPALELHGSTQMTISSPESAPFALGLGLSRVVLPRELSTAEIRRFVERAQIEVEVFIHGALCVSWSGQCLTSEAWGGRSANRGQCAQSCRMPYDLVLDGRVQDLGDLEYLLSPKDLAGFRAVPELIELGVHGLKIEGRQKGPVYVASAVEGYRRWVDALASGRTPEAARAAMQDDLARMTLAYTRGFGDGFLAGSDHQTLVEGRFPKHRGAYLGRVSAVRGSTVIVHASADGRPWTGNRAGEERKLEAEGAVSSPLPALGGAAQAASGPAAAAIELRAGMGVVFDAGTPEDKKEPGGPIFRVERRGDEIALGFGDPGPDLARVRLGDRVWITSDPAIVRATEKLLEAQDPAGRWPVVIELDGAAGTTLAATARCGAYEAEATSASRLAPARGGGIDADLLAGKLGALGGTPFRLEALHSDALAPGLHLPVSELKEMRRHLVAALEAQVERGPARTIAAPGAVSELRAEAPAKLAPARSPLSAPLIVPLCRTLEQLEAAIECGLREVELDWMEMVGLARAVERARQAGLRVTLATLRVQKPGEESFDGRLAALAPDAVLARHWGAVMHFSGMGEGAPLVHGDFSLNVTNSITAHHLFALGLETLTVAHDLDEAQLFALLDHVPAERMAVVLHHRIATFHTEHCVYAHALSAGRDFRTCGRPCEKHELSVRDHLGREHPILVDAGCRNTVFNAEVQSAAALVPQLVERGVRRFRVELTRESKADSLAVLEAYRDLMGGSLSPSALLSRLHVRAQHGVSSAPMTLIV